jgi:hypothetical protein
MCEFDELCSGLNLRMVLVFQLSSSRHVPDPTKSIPKRSSSWKLSAEIGASVRPCTAAIMPAKNDAGYALVPTSSDKRALEEFYEECNGMRWSVQRNWGVGEPCANGRAVQVGPMKPKLKPPGTNRLKLKSEQLLSISLQLAFKFNLRHYTTGGTAWCATAGASRSCG